MPIWWILASPIADITVAVEPWRSFNESIRIRNDKAELVVVPELGRIMEFRALNGPNLLWVNPDVDHLQTKPGDWKNYGGDKVWVSPQSNWNWPPDPLLDGSPYEYKLIPNGVHIHSRVGGPIPVVLERWITLVDGKAEARVENKMTLAGGPPHKVGIWQVLQMNDPDWARLGTGDKNGIRTIIGGKEVAPVISIGRTQALIRRSPTLAPKFGTTDPSGTILAKKGSWYLEVFAPVEPGAEYPDGGCAQQVFSGADPERYQELELLSPMRTLKANDNLTFIVRLKISGR